MEQSNQIDRMREGGNLNRRIRIKKALKTLLVSKKIRLEGYLKEPCVAVFMKKDIDDNLNKINERIRSLNNFIKILRKERESGKRKQEERR